jgi:hypothetical protein
VKRPKDLTVGAIVTFRWVDSSQGDFEEDLREWEEDCSWSAVGEVVKCSKRFLTISYGRYEQKPWICHSPLSVPWTQVLDLEVLR